MSDKPPLHLVGQVLVSPALLRQAARILHREAKQLREAYHLPGADNQWEDRQAALDHQRYKMTAQSLDRAAEGPLR